LSTAVSEVAQEVSELQNHLRQLVDAFSEQADSLQGCSTASAAGSSMSRGGKTLPALKTGSTIGPYRVLGFLRAGGMGEVYRAVDERLDRTVAIKVLPDRLSQDPARRERLRQEARLLSSISHPHICTLFDVGYQTGRDFLVMEYLEGRTLAERLAESPLQIQDALRIALEVAEALAAAHSIGIVHRDLKPSNIMLTGPTDSRPGVKLLDFGLARAVAQIDSGVRQDCRNSTASTITAGLEGTLAYMAPEQFDDRGSDGRADIWALGVILYEMVCGRRPFAGKNPASIICSVLHSQPTAPRELSSACSPDLSRVIERCMAKSPQQRWPNCVDLAEQFRRDTTAEQVRGEPGPPIARPRRLLSRLRITAASVATLIVLGSMSAAQGASLAVTTSATSQELEAREDFLLHGRIHDIQDLKVGVTGSARALVTWQGRSHSAHIQSVDTYLSQSSRATNLRDYYAYNVAAYRLDRLLNLNMVPVSVRRGVGREQAAVTWWVDNVEMMEVDRRKLDLHPPDTHYWNEQIHQMHIFQELIWNSDLNQGNILITDDWRIWIIDFTRAFRGYRKLQHPDRLRRIGRQLYDALARLDEETLRKEMKGLLLKSQVRAILSRRDRILEVFDARIAELGEEKVIRDEPVY